MMIFIQSLLFFSFQIFGFYRIKNNHHSDTKKILTLVPQKNVLDIQTAYLLPFNSKKPKFFKERLQIKGAQTKRLDFVIANNRVKFKSKALNAVIGSHIVSTYDANDLFRTFPLSFIKDANNNEGESMNVYFKNLESPVDGKTLFSISLQGVSDMIKLNIGDTVYIVMQDDEIPIYKENLIQALHDTNISADYIIPKSLSMVMRHHFRGYNNSDYIVIVDSNGPGLSMNLYQIIEQQEEKEIGEEKEIEEEKEQVKVDEKEIAKEVEKAGKKEKKKSDSQIYEYKPTIKHIYGMHSSLFSDDNLFGIFDTFICEIVEEKFNEMLISKNIIERNDYVELSYFPFNPDQLFDQYFFKIDPIKQKLISAYTAYLKFLNENQKKTNIDSSKESILRNYKLLDVEIFDCDCKIKYSVTSIVFDLKILYTRIHKFHEDVTHELKKMEKTILEEAVKSINNEKITMDNVLDELDVFADGNALQQKFDLMSVFEHFTITSRSFDKSWSKGACCYAIYDVKDERVISLPISGKFPGIDSNYENIQNELNVRQSVDNIIETDAYKNFDSKNVVDEEVLHLLEIKRKILGKERILISELKHFEHNYMPVFYQHMKLPESKKELKNLLDHVEKRIKVDKPDIFELIEKKFLETVKWYEDNIERKNEQNYQMKSDENDAQKNEKIKFSVIDNMRSNLNAEIRAAEQIVSDRKRIKEIKKQEELKKAEEEKKKKEQEQNDALKEKESHNKEKKQTEEKQDQKEDQDTEKDIKDPSKGVSNFFKSLFTPKKEDDKKSENNEDNQHEDKNEFDYEEELKKLEALFKDQQKLMNDGDFNATDKLAELLEQEKKESTRQGSLDLNKDKILNDLNKEHDLQSKNIYDSLQDKKKTDEDSTQKDPFAAHHEL